MGPPIPQPSHSTQGVSSYSNDSQMRQNPRDHQQFIRKTSPLENTETQAPPGHKKSQSMINSKIANLVMKSGKAAGHLRANPNVTTASKVEKP
jgi:hypothetical protein